MSQSRVILAVILSLALILRLGYGLTVSNDAFLQYDGRDYFSISKNLWLHQKYAVNHYRWFEPEPSDAAGLHPDFSRPPLLPLVGAVLYGLPGDWFLWARILQLVFGGLVVFAGYLLGERLFNERVGLATAVVIALFPHAIYYSAYWSTETLFGLFVLLSLLAAYRARQQKTLNGFLLAGLSMGVMCLARPNGVALMAGLLVWAMALLPRGHKARGVGMVVVGVLLTLSPWFIRNAAHGVYTPLTAFGPYNMWLGMNETMYDMYRNRHAPEYLELMAKLYDVDSAERVQHLRENGLFSVHDCNRFWLKEACIFARNHPAKAASVIAARLRHFWTPFPSRATTPAPVYCIAISSTLLLYALGIYGIVRLCKDRHRSVMSSPYQTGCLPGDNTAKMLLLFLPILFGMVAAMLFVFHLRFRFPIMELPLCALGGVGLDSLVGHLSILDHQRGG